MEARCPQRDSRLTTPPPLPSPTPRVYFGAANQTWLLCQLQTAHNWTDRARACAEEQEGWLATTRPASHGDRFSFSSCSRPHPHLVFRHLFRSQSLCRMLLIIIGCNNPLVFPLFTLFSRLSPFPTFILRLPLASFPLPYPSALPHYSFTYALLIGGFFSLSLVLFHSLSIRIAPSSFPRPPTSAFSSSLFFSIPL